MLGSRVRAPKGALERRSEMISVFRIWLWMRAGPPDQRKNSMAQRKIPVDLHFIVRLRHKASGAALGLSCAVCFEQPAGVFAGCGAVCQAKILASLKIKNGISLTPLN